jgi:hypothetical protein
VRNEDFTDVSSVRRCGRRFNSGEDAGDRPRGVSQSFRQAYSALHKEGKKCDDNTEQGGKKTPNFVKDLPVMHANIITIVDIVSEEK